MMDPNFIGIGAQKSGTSWIYQMLRQHPEVYVPSKVKELHFFNKQINYNKGINWYRSLFEEYENQRAIGEFTPNYFWTSDDIREIKESGRTRNPPYLVHKHYPEMKFILSLRNPITRAISAYYHHIGARRISPFTRIIDVGKKFGIITMGFYDIHLKNWFKYFSPDQFLIIIYEENIVKNFYQTIETLYQFIGVNTHFKPQNMKVRYNMGRSHFYLRMHYYSPKIAEILMRKLPPILLNSKVWKIPIYEREIDYLEKIYSQNNKNLSTLISQKLPW